MKNLKTILIILATIAVCWLAYCWFSPREEWQTRKPCAGCETLKSQEQQKIIGTITIDKNSKTFFTDPIWNFTYNLIPCDAHCADQQLHRFFTKMGVSDNATKQPIYFEVEGTMNEQKNEFLYSSAIMLNSRKFINPEKVKGLFLLDIISDYQPVNEETFPLNRNHGEFRGALDAFFTEEQRQQPIPIKEVTWEVNDSTLLTIWFIEKQKQWTSIDQYQWQKGTEF